MSWLMALWVGYRLAGQPMAPPKEANINKQLNNSNNQQLRRKRNESEVKLMNERVDLLMELIY